MPMFTLDILDREANVLHSESYAQTGRGNEIKVYLRERANSLMKNAKSLGVHNQQPAAFKIREAR